MRYDRAIGTEIIARFDARPELLVQILNAIVTRYGFIPEDAIRHVAEELNLSRADVHGVVHYYHDFRTAPPGKTIVKVCQAEACQSMGSRELTAHVRQRLDLDLNETSADGRYTLEPVYCLGNCACSPAVMINDRVLGRVDAARFDDALAADRPEVN